MSDWLKNIPPEYYIIIIGGALLLVLVIIILAKIFKIEVEVAGRALKMTEEIVNIDNDICSIIKVVNKSYIDNEIREIGILYQKQKYIIKEEDVRINARDKHEVLITHDDIIKLLAIDDYKIKKLKFYYENNIGTIIKAKGRTTKREIKKKLNEAKIAFIEQQRKEKAANKEADRKERFETGNLTASDRFKTFFANLFRPLKRAINKRRVNKNRKVADKKAEQEVEEEREYLILQQKLIYEQQLRDNRKDELRKEYKIDELKANLEEMQKDESEQSEFVPVEEIIGTEPTKKEKKEKKKMKKAESNENTDLDFIEQDEEMVDESSDAEKKDNDLEDILDE